MTFDPSSFIACLVYVKLSPPDPRSILVNNCCVCKTNLIVLSSFRIQQLYTLKSHFSLLQLTGSSVYMSTSATYWYFTTGMGARLVAAMYACLECLCYLTGPDRALLHLPVNHSSCNSCTHYKLLISYGHYPNGVSPLSGSQK